MVTVKGKHRLIHTYDACLRAVVLTAPTSDTNSVASLYLANPLNLSS